MAKRVGANERQKLQSRKTNAKRVTGKATVGLGKILLIGILLIGVGYGGRIGFVKVKKYLKSVEIFKVDKVVLKGVHGEDSLKIINLLGIDSLNGSISVSGKKIKREIAKENLYDEISVSRKLPSTLEIKLKERKPFVFVNVGTVKLMDKNGNLWPIKSRRYWSIPLLSGLVDTTINDKNVLTKDSMRKVDQFMNGLKATEDSRLDGISQVEFRDDETIKIHLESSSIVAKLDRDEIKSDLFKLWQVLGNIKERKEKIPSEVDLSCGKFAFVK